MIADIDEVILPQIKRLAGKAKFPGFEVTGQLELARIAKEHARDLTHLREVITEISETWDHCPDAGELKAALKGASGRQTTEADLPAACSACKGRPWVIAEMGGYEYAKRCDCARGLFLAAKDAERRKAAK